MASHRMAAESPGTPEPVPRARRQPRFAWLACGLATLLLAVGVLAAAEHALYLKVERFDLELTRSGLSGGTSGAEPRPLNIGVLGVVNGRLVSVMMLHFDADRRGADVWFLPDSRVGGVRVWQEAMPPRPEERDLLAVAERIEAATGQHLEHFAVFDWGAIAELTARLDGVDLVLGPEGAKQYWPEAQWLPAVSVAEFVDRDVCEAGDDALDAETLRLRRQMVLLKTVMQETLHQELVRNPLSLYQTLDVLAQNLALDRTWKLSALRSLVISLRHLRSRNIAYHVMDPDNGVAPPRAAVGQHAC